MLHRSPQSLTDAGEPGLLSRPCRASAGDSSHMLLQSQLFLLSSWCTVFLFPYEQRFALVITAFSLIDFRPFFQHVEIMPNTRPVPPTAIPQHLPTAVLCPPLTTTSLQPPLPTASPQGLLASRLLLVSSSLPKGVGPPFAHFPRLSLATPSRPCPELEAEVEMPKSPLRDHLTNPPATRTEEMRRLQERLPGCGWLPVFSRLAAAG